MRSVIIGALVLAAFITSADVAFAKPQSVEVKGQTYYVVTAADSAMDSGDEVCAAVGQKCIGYTVTDHKVCTTLHPNAKTQSGGDGSKSPFYCDGSPQGGVCANEKNTCRVCPNCNIGVTCGESISSLYREMYVQCGLKEESSNLAIKAPPMWGTFFAKPGQWWGGMRNSVVLSFDNFRNILARLQKYNVTIQKNIVVSVQGVNGTESADVPSDSYVCEFYQQNKKLVTCGGLPAADSFCVTAMNSQYAKAALCQDNGVVVCYNPCTTKPAQVMPKQCAFDADRPRGNQAAPLNFCNETKTIQVNMNLGLKRAGEECNHGGDCKTGICLGVVDSGPRKNLCSCSQSRHDTSCN